ncbi:MAG: hypothetical protein LW878_11345, partial [Proteobacteria bacterium]|nr:hypothetical protein [Pseudomonadota bacterium]
MQPRLTRIILSLLMTLAILIALEIASSALLPAFGWRESRLAFNVVIILFMAFKISTPLLPWFVMILQLVHAGFSVEGWFDKVKIKTDKMNKQKTSIWDLFTKGKPAAEAFAQAVTAEGVAVFYEGDLIEGTAVFIELEGERIPA